MIIDNYVGVLCNYLFTSQACYKSLCTSSYNYQTGVNSVECVILSALCVHSKTNFQQK